MLMRSLRRCGLQRTVFLSLIVVALTILSGLAQQANQVTAADNSAAPLTLTLPDAVARALANAKSEIAARGLVVTVVQAYYGFVVAQRKYSTAQRAADEAGHFFDITQKLERGGEVAHSDSIKAQLQFLQQQRALQDAEVEIERSRMELAVLIFPNFNQNFATVDDLENIEPLPPFQEVEAEAGKNSPQLRGALASLKAASQEVAVAWNSFLPSLGLDYSYGIDANHYAVNEYDHDPLVN